MARAGHRFGRLDLVIRVGPQPARARTGAAGRPSGRSAGRRGLAALERLGRRGLAVGQRPARLPAGRPGDSDRGRGGAVGGAAGRPAGRASSSRSSMPGLRGGRGWNSSHSTPGAESALHTRCPRPRRRDQHRDAPRGRGWSSVVDAAPRLPQGWPHAPRAGALRGRFGELGRPCRTGDFLARPLTALVAPPAARPPGIAGGTGLTRRTWQELDPDTVSEPGNPGYAVGGTGTETCRPSRPGGGCADSVRSPEVPASHIVLILGYIDLWVGMGKTLACHARNLPCTFHARDNRVMHMSAL
jgi:hypothetical protein